MDFYNDTPKDYVSLNLGSKSATESAATAEASAPSVQPQSGINVGPAAKAPAGYGPGETSAAAMQMEDSTWSKVANFLIGAGTQPGEMNVLTKTKLAQHAALLEDSKNKLAWANYQDTHAVIQENLKKANRQAITDGMEFAANVKGHMAGMTPEQMDKMIPMYTKMLGAFHPELASIPDLFKQSPATMLGFDSAAADPNYGPGLQRLAMGRPYTELIKDPQIASYIGMHGRDVINKINTRLTTKDKEKIAEGKVGQAEYIGMYEKAMQDQSLAGAKPVDHAFARHALNTDYGEAIMTSLGIQTDAHALAMSKKEKPTEQDTMGTIAAKEYKKHQAVVEFDKANPGSLPSDVVKNANKQMGLLLKTESKDQSENPNNSVIQRFRALALENGVSAENMEDIKKMKAGSPGQKLALGLWNQAQGEKDRATAQSSMDVRMESPHDMNEKPVYKMDKGGNPVRVTTPISQREYLTGKAGFTMTPDQKEKLGTITYAEGEGMAIFDLADKAFKATSTAGRGVQTSKEKVLSSPLTAWTISDTNPDLKVYLDERNALLGKFSKSLGGEAGVLTNQDIERVVKMFPTGADTPKIRQMKKDAFKRIVQLNKRAITGLLTSNVGTENEGIVTPEQMNTLRTSKALRDEIEGTIGQMEGIGKQTEEKTAERGSSLLDRMKAGK